MSLGWPICGSSEICYNEAYPVKAVIFLGQAEENDGRRLRYFDAIKAMISQITVNGWNPQFVEKIWNLQKISRLRFRCLSMDVTWKKRQ